jgi:hypothetical protein
MWSWRPLNHLPEGNWGTTHIGHISSSYHKPSCKIGSPSRPPFFCESSPLSHPIHTNRRLPLSKKIGSLPTTRSVGRQQRWSWRPVADLRRQRRGELVSGPSIGPRGHATVGPSLLLAPGRLLLQRHSHKGEIHSSL